MLMLIISNGVDNVRVDNLNTSHVNVNLFHLYPHHVAYTYLNTSHVNVNHSPVDLRDYTYDNLNTSHVNVNPKRK